jgi:ACS family glucarate transporter-like MFS transporter
MIGFGLGASGVLVIPFVSTPGAAVAGFALATFGVELSISPSWAYCMDIGGKSSGALSGAMNMAGNIGAVVSSNVFPLLYGATGGPGAYFMVAAVLNITGAVCWLGMRSPRRAC